MNLRFWICLGLLPLAARTGWGSVPAESPFVQSQPGMAGQLRLRTEYDGKALAETSGNRPLLSTGLRARLAYTARPSDRAEIKLELQDARVFGSETPANPAVPATATVANSHGTDLLQAYARLQAGSVQAALGRQKLSLGSGRFLSTLEWHPVSRAFDGASFHYDRGGGGLTGVAFLVRDSSERKTGDRDWLAGLFYAHTLSTALSAEAYAFYDQTRLPSDQGGVAARNFDLAYFGERLAGKAGVLAYEEEFIWQAGEIRTDRDLTSAAFQLALRLGAVLGPHRANAGVDIMSGDAEPADHSARGYRANYYFAHAYFGWMDYFASNPGYGVIDYRLDGDFAFLPDPQGKARMSLRPQYHFFAPQDAPAGRDDPYGQEFDLEMHGFLFPKSDWVLGAGIFLPGDGAARLPAAGLGAGQDSRPGYFLYFMPVLNF